MESAAILYLICWAAQRSSAFAAAASASTFEVWSQALASTLISSLWQGAVVACGLALCLRLAPTIPARLRYAIWAAGFAALACLPFLPALIERFIPSAFAASSANSFGLAAVSSSHSLPHPWLALDAGWSLGIAALWFAASLVRAIGLAAQAVRMRRLWNSASPVGAAHGGAFEQSADALSSALRQLPKLCVTSDLDRPCVIGFFRPRILIPAWLLNRLTPAELEQVVLHESEHLRRMDDWINLMQKVCLVVFPLNPALWWLERRLCAEREMACDDAVVDRTQAPRAYAACLAGLAEKGLEQREAALSLGAWQHRPELAIRVHRLLRRPPTLSPALSAASMTLIGCGLVAGTIALAHSPQLVAFVAPANPASNPLSSSAHSVDVGLQQNDAGTDFAQSSIAFAQSGAQPYRVVKTMALLPAARAASLPRSSSAIQRTISPGQVNQARQAGDSSNSGHSLASLVPEAVAARIKSQQTPRPQAEQISQSAEAPASQTSWVVLTTFEERQNTGSNPEAQGDTVVGDTTSNPAGAKTLTSISVTRLVLRFVQTDSNAQPASNVPPASNSAQPIAIPYRDGWFVIQL